MSFHYVRPTLYKGHKLSCLASSHSSNTKQVQTKSVCSLPYKTLVLYLESGILKWCSRSLVLNLMVIKFCILVELRDCPRFGLSGSGRIISNTTLNYPFFSFRFCIILQNPQNSTCLGHLGSLIYIIWYQSQGCHLTKFCSPNTFPKQKHKNNLHDRALPPLLQNSLLLA